MLNNLVIVSGPHGSGKTTLIKRLKKEFHFILVNEDVKKFRHQFYWRDYPGEIDYFHRQTLKLAERAVQNYHYEKLARQEKNKLIFGDRGIYDEKIYREALLQMGWLTNAQAESIRASSKIFFSRNLYEPWTIVLNPPLDKIKKQLKNRWKKESAWKFRETDFHWLEVVREKFKSLKGEQNIFYITKPDEKKIMNWVYTFYKPKN